MTDADIPERPSFTRPVSMVRLRASGVAGAIAILAIVAVTMLAVWHIWGTYTAARESLASYAHAAQKPVFQVASVHTGDSWVSVELVNQGPGSAIVHRVCLYKYLGGVAPTGMQCVEVGRRVGPGDTLDVNVTVEDPRLYLWLDRPLRILLVTDKGLELVSKPVTYATLEADIRLPEYVTDLDNVTVRYMVLLCGGVSTPVYSALLLANKKLADIPVCSTNMFNSTVLPLVCRSDTRPYIIHVEARVPGVGPCKIMGMVEYFAHVVGPPRGSSEEAAQTALTAYELVARSFQWVTDLKPGTVVHLDVDLPETPYMAVESPPASQASSYIVDFSWLYTPYLGMGADKTARIPGEWNTTMELIADGVVMAESYLPYCEAYPKPGVKGPMSDDMYDALTRGLDFESTLTGGGSAHSGVVLYAACNDTFKQLWKTFICPMASEKPLLEVTVPLSLPSGKVVVVPVFSYDDGDSDDRLSVKIVVDVVSPDGSVAARAEFNRPGETWSLECFPICLPVRSDTVVQLAPVLTLDSNGGEYKLRISVYILNDCDDTPDFSYAAIVLSKILVYRVGSLPVAAFKLPLPFGHLDASTGQFEPPELYWHAAIVANDTSMADSLLDPYIYVPGVIDRVVWLEDGDVRATPGLQASRIDARYSRAADGYELTISASGNVVVALPLYGSDGNPYSLSRIAVNAWLERQLWDTYTTVEPSLLVAATSESEGWAELTLSVPEGRYIIVAEFYTPITSWSKPPYVEVDAGSAIIAAKTEGMVYTGSAYTFTSGNVHRLALLVQGPALIALRVHPGWACSWLSWFEGCGSLVALTYLIGMPGNETLLHASGAPVYLHVYNIKPVASVRATLADATTGTEVFTMEIGRATEAWFGYVPGGVPIDAVAPASHDYILYLVGVQQQQQG